MKIVDLKDGMVVELRNGDKLIVRGELEWANEEEESTKGELSFREVRVEQGEVKEIEKFTDMGILSDLVGVNTNITIDKVWDTTFALTTTGIRPLWDRHGWNPQYGDLVLARQSLNTCWFPVWYVGRGASGFNCADQLRLVDGELTGMITFDYIKPLPKIESAKEAK